MARALNIKCLECSKINWRIKTNKEPKCYKSDRCKRKRAYYRNIDYYRAKLRQYHRYLKFLGDKCFVCGSLEQLQAHHIKPQSLGGDDKETNIVTLCSNCHKIITIYNRRLGLERPLI